MEMHGGAQARERTEWAKPTSMTTTMWATLRADRLKPLSSGRKDMSIVTAISFDIDKRATESVANFAGIDILTIAYKDASERGR